MKWKILHVKTKTEDRGKWKGKKAINLEKIDVKKKG